MNQVLSLAGPHDAALPYVLVFMSRGLQAQVPGRSGTWVMSASCRPDSEMEKPLSLKVVIGRQAWGCQIIPLFVLGVLREVGRLNVDVKLSTILNVNP